MITEGDIEPWIEKEIFDIKRGFSPLIPFMYLSEHPQNSS